MGLLGQATSSRRHLPIYAGAPAWSARMAWDSGQEFTGEKPAPRSQGAGPAAGYRRRAALPAGVRWR